MHGSIELRGEIKLGRIYPAKINDNYNEANF